MELTAPGSVAVAGHARLIPAPAAPASTPSLLGAAPGWQRLPARDGRSWRSLGAGQAGDSDSRAAHGDTAPLPGQGRSCAWDGGRGNSRREFWVLTALPGGGGTEEGAPPWAEGAPVSRRFPEERPKALTSSLLPWRTLTRCFHLETAPLPLQRSQTAVGLAQTNPPWAARALLMGQSFPHALREEFDPGGCTPAGREPPGTGLVSP